jgi:hypothetical protein
LPKRVQQISWLDAAGMASGIAQRLFARAFDGEKVNKVSLL